MEKKEVRERQSWPESLPAFPPPPSQALPRSGPILCPEPSPAWCLRDLAFAPTSLTPAQPSPRPAPPPPGCMRGDPSKPRAGSGLPAPQAWAPGAINHKWRCWGFLGPLPRDPRSPGAREQFLSVLTPQTGSKQHERNQSENVGRSWTSKTPFRPHRLRY